MPDKSKVLFLATDDTTGKGHSWAKESAEIQEALTREGKGEQFTLTTRPGVDSHRLISLMLDENPEVLHFISEVSEQQIVLPNPRGKKIVQKPEILAKLFGHFKTRLKWVVMSGCFSEAQASAISQAIPQGSVIGFDCNMPPEQRISASVGMYLAMKSDKNQPAQVAGLARINLEMAGGRGDHIYLYQAGMEIQPDHPPKNVQVEPPDPPDIKFSDRIGSKIAYHCDRAVQRGEFLHPYENDQRTFNFFAVHGSTPQSHHGLVESFYHQFLYDEDFPEESKKYQVVLHQADDLDKYKAEIRSKLLNKMGMGKLLRLDNDKEMTAAAKRFAEKGVDTVAVEFRVKSSYWKAFTPELIQWFIARYCRIQEEGFSSPAFYFFLSVIYEEEVDQITSLQEIRKLVQRLPDCTILTELQQVQKADIFTWIEGHITPDSQRQTKIWHTYFFEDLPSYDMEEVQRRLDTMINLEPSDYD